MLQSWLQRKFTATSAQTCLNRAASLMTAVSSIRNPSLKQFHASSYLQE